MKKLSETIADMMRPLDVLRAQIRANQQQQAELKGYPLTPDEARDAFTGWLDHQSELGRNHLREMLQAFVHPGANVELFPPDMSPAHVARTAGHVLVALNRPALEAFAAENLADLPTGNLSRASIADDLKRLDAELFRMEVREERFVREFETQGLLVSRRADANPAVVLADLEDGK